MHGCGPAVVIVRCWHTPRRVHEWAERYEASAFEALLHELGLDHQHKALVAKKARLALRLRMALVLRVLLQCHCHPPERRSAKTTTCRHLVLVFLRVDLWQIGSIACLRGSSSKSLVMKGPTEQPGLTAQECQRVQAR